MSSAGLILDIIGVIMIWRYGLPQALSRGGHQYMVLEQVDTAEKAKAARFDCMSKVGLSLVIVGFALQLAGNFTVQIRSLLGV